MKNYLICLALLLTACTSETDLGQCVGVMDDKDPTLQYKVSIWNAIVATFFVETFIVPVIYVTSYIQCPVAKKSP